MIIGRTNILGIIGNPVEHSLSPIFQNYMIKKSGLDYVYMPFKVNLNNLSHFMKGLKTLENLRGLNVTIPFKEEVLDYIDVLSEESKKIGAINTILVENDKFYGYNTDVYGIIYTLKMKLKINDLKNDMVVLIGAGGASRALIWCIHGMGARRIFVINRTFDRFKKLSLWAKNELKLELEFLSWDKIGQIFEILKPDLLINSTPIGLKGEKINLDFEKADKNLKIFDMTYNLEGSYFVNTGRKYGFLCCDGLPMLIAQGVESFKIWTGLTFNYDKILLYIKRRLKRCQRF
jgi:shikimate dehydrogenase